MGTGKPPKRADARGVAGERLTEPRPAAAPGAHGDRPALSPAIVLAALVMLAGAAAAAYLLVGAGGDGEPEVRARPHRLPVPWVDPDGVRPIVGALDVNPGDGSLWLATNTGLFRLPRDAKRPERVAGHLTTKLGSGEISAQLVIRFRGPDDMIGSGHPPADSALPSALGLLESHDAGRTWTGVSDVGYADFHAIQLSRGTPPPPSTAKAR